jgi:choline dehydrogenase-like flavoprotein
VTLNSSDPFAAPLIDPGLLATQFDLLALSAGVHMAERFISAPAWKGYIIAPTVDLASMSEADLETTIRENSFSASHISGTAGMSARGAPYGVVDPDLRVKGMTGLSIMDASVLVSFPLRYICSTDG